MRIRWRIAIAAVFLFTALPLAAGIYFWTDENGVRHYSNVAPAETENEVQRLEEVPPSSPPQRSEPVDPTDTGAAGVTEPAASGEQAPADDSAPASAEAEEKSSQESGPESESEAAAGPIQVPTEQNEIVQGEKATVRELQRQLEQNASQRSELVEKERKRLTGALEQLQKTPVSEFGSQKNKTRAVGYYRYRLEALQNSPDSYFQYGDSETD